MDELLPHSSHTIRRPLSPLRDNTSPHLSSGLTSTRLDGSHESHKIGKTVKMLRKKLGQLFVRPASQSSPIPVAPKAVCAAAIDILPDNVLLQIIDFCRVGHTALRSPFPLILEWGRLVQVCRRWRQLIFSSPGYLDLFLFCTYGTPVRSHLGIWPAFPIAIDYVEHLYVNSKNFSINDEDNVSAALEHPDRVCCLKLPVTRLQLEKVAQPFPILTHLWLSSENRRGYILPSSFLGGSAPRLQQMCFDGINYPALPTFLSSTSDLVHLFLHRIPRAWYVSPEVMVASLATLTRLQFLSIGFQSSTSHSSGQEAPPTRIVFPVLTFFGFQGPSEYLEDLMAQIDAPRVASIQINYLNRQGFEVPQLSRFIAQTQILQHAHTMDAGVHFYPSTSLIFIEGLSYGLAENHRMPLELRISCHGLASQVSYLAEVLSQSSVVLHNVHHLSLYADSFQPGWRDDMDHMAWLALFRSFIAVETLRIVYPIVAHVTDVLNSTTAEMAQGILPALYLLLLQGEPEGSVDDFSATRQLSGLPPITIAKTASEFFSKRRSR